MSILVNVINQKMYISSTMEGIVAGSQRFVKFKFNLSEEWDGLRTFAQFSQGGKAYNQYLDNDNSVYLPSEIVAGTVTLMLYGSLNTTIGTTNYLTLKINKNNLVSDASSTDISESLYNQLVDKVNIAVSSVENIDIGTRNLATGTADMVVGLINQATRENGQWRASGTGTITNIDITDAPLPNINRGVKVIASLANKQIGVVQDKILLNSNNTYTLSCWVRGSAASGLKCKLQPFYASSTDNGGSKDFDITNEWRFISYTTTNNPQDNAKYSAAYIYLLPASDNDTMEICGVKFEKGNKATDWSPAPEDLATKNDVTSEINSIEIGGRNLLLNTKSFTAASSTALNGALMRGASLVEEKYRNLSVRSATLTESVTEICIYKLTDFNLGDSFTFSFYAKGDITELRAFFFGDTGYLEVSQCVNSQGEVSTQKDGRSSFYITPDWQRYWITWKLKDTGNITVPKWLMLRTFNSSEGQAISVCGCKLEKGNKATDWSPSPDDLEQRVAALEAALLSLGGES